MQQSYCSYSAMFCQNQLPAEPVMWLWATAQNTFFFFFFVHFSPLIFNSLVVAGALKHGEFCVAALSFGLDTLECERCHTGCICKYPRSGWGRFLRCDNELTFPVGFNLLLSVESHANTWTFDEEKQPPYESLCLTVTTNLASNNWSFLFKTVQPISSSFSISLCPTGFFQLADHTVLSANLKSLTRSGAELVG